VSQRVAIYIRHPPDGGRDWLVTVSGEPDARFATEEAATHHALALAVTESVRGARVSLRIEGRDGTWRTWPVGTFKSEPWGSR